MPWFFVDDGFADSKPVMRLDSRLRNEATGLWVRCGAWSAKEETDGHVPLDVVRGFGGTPRLIRALHENAQLWVETSPESWRNSREILFGNWEKWQKTRAENETRRKREAEKKQTWRTSKKGRNFVTNSDDEEMSTGDMAVDIEDDSKCMSTRESPVLSRAIASRPDPTRPKSTLVTRDEKGGLGDAHDRRPQCSEHEENSDGPCHACRRRREWDRDNAGRLQADELQRRRDAKTAADQARADCELCDGDGWLLGEDGTPTEPAIKCTDHQSRKDANA